MKRVLLAATSILAISAATAVAADRIDPPAYVYWDGPYIGANAGVAILDGDARVLLGAVPTNFDLDDTGFTAGGQAGWNWQHDQWVFGIEGDFNYVDVEDAGIANVVNQQFGSYNLESDWYATLRGRAGFAMDASLFYVTGGVAFMDADLRATQIIAAAASPTASDSEVLVGFAVGGGIEHKFSESWSAKAEYLYMNFESKSLSAGIATARVEPELHVIRAGINWHFCTGGAC